MNAQCLTAGTELNANAVYPGTAMTENLIANTSIREDWFATIPVLPAIITYKTPDEEELHTSFEHAISGRLIAVNKRLSLISGPLTTSEHVHLQITRPLQQTYITANEANQNPSLLSTSRAHTMWLRATWQRMILLASLAMIFLLAGFDIMGLLVLHSH
jgi:hypothetical protein